MKKYKRLFLIDGDSFVYKALNGMNRIDPEDKILILGNLINQENIGRIFIISHDHGYYKLINRYRTKYGIQAETLDLKKSIQAAL